MIEAVIYMIAGAASYWMIRGRRDRAILKKAAERDRQQALQILQMKLSQPIRSDYGLSGLFSPVGERSKPRPSKSPHPPEILV